jgi:hypothetical protein
MRNTDRYIKLNVETGDAVDFIHIIEDIIDGFLNKREIEDVVVIKIKNWFDHKWLKFSGNGIIHWDSTLHPDKVALAEHYKDKITIPPFNPNRILYQKLFSRLGTENKKLDKSLHTKQWSSSNLNNRIHTKTNNGLFVWFSSNTISNQKGSLMIYRVEKENVQTWYLSIENKTKWTITKVKGANLDNFQKLIK